jgi:hypothetical protein
MKFINRYTKSDSLNYFYSEEFVQDKKSFIFTIGNTKDNGLVTCTNTDGQILWEKIYTITKESEPLSFKKIIQLKPHKEFGYQYVIHATTGKKHYLLSIDIDKGKLNWIKHLPWKDEDVIVHLEVSYKPFEFYVVISDRNQIDSSNNPYVSKFLGNGSFIAGNSILIKDQEFIVEAVNAFKDGLVIAGRYIEKDSRGVIIELDNDLKLNKSIQIVNPYSAIHDIKWIENKYLVSGYLVKEQAVFVSLIDGSSSSEMYHISNTKNNNSQLQITKGHFYLLTHHDTHGIIHFLDFDFKVLWSKELYFDDLGNGLRQFNFNTVTKHIVTNVFNQKVESLLVYADGKFITCKTKELKTYSRKKSQCDIKKLGLDLKQKDLKPKNYDGNAQNIKSKIIEYCPSSNVDLEKSSISANPDCILPSGGTSTITVQLFDTAGNPINSGNNVIVINTSFGTISSTTNNNNGTYTAILSSAANGTATLSFTANGNNAQQTTTVVISKDCDDTSGEVDLNVSTIYANPNQILANGTSTSTITVNLLDGNGNPVTTNQTVAIIFANGNSYSATLNGGTSNQGGGIYTVDLLSTINEENVVLSFKVGDQEAFGNTATVDIHKRFAVGPISRLQSTNLYMQAAGSLGNDGSLSGMHLRWTLKGYLGDIHLPKGNNATSNNNFNKADDFVRIYRAPYIPQYLTLDFQELSPNVVDNNNYLWIYHLNGKPFYIYFKNSEKYDEIKANINPLTSSYSFIQSYGKELIEIDHKTTLSLAIELEPSTPSTTTQAEILSVENNNLSAIKYITARKTFSGTGRFVEENIRSIRFRTTSNHIKKIRFELYVDSLEFNTSQDNWTPLGAYAITTSNSEAMNRLEDLSGSDLVHGQWPRYNDGETVNKDNYIDRWNGEELESYGEEYYEYYDRRLKTVVKRYIEISDDQPNNPVAMEAIPYSDILPEGVISQDQDTQSISNLTVIQLASMDYHMARMLGLGYIDRSINLNQTEEKFIYLAEYFTVDNLTDGQPSSEEIQHLYLSLPTSMTEERLPISVNLLEPVLGTNNPDGNLNNLLDEEGYLYDGKQRFISLINENIPEVQSNIDFYENTNEFSTSDSTDPVYLGIEYKRFEPDNPDASNWRKPELSYNSEYYNYSDDDPLTSVSYESVPLMIPEANETLFLHREREEGWHRYSSYGINWFSRSQMSSVFWDLETRFRPQNRLLPPSNTKACLIVEESPLMLTSASEQDLFEANTNNDKTLVRLTFNHHIDHDRLTYQINDESMAGYSDPLNPDAIFKDSREVFADKVNLFFRNRPPATVSGKIKSIQPHPNNALVIIRTESYVLNSTGDTILPEIEVDQLSHYIGSVFMFNTIKYIIHELTQSNVVGEGPIFTVYKEIISEAILNETDPDPSMPLDPPEFTNEGEPNYNPNTIIPFNTVENMLTESNWQVGNSTEVNKLDFQIEIGYSSVDDIHREVLDEESISGVPEQILEKSRGIWHTSVIAEELRPQAISPEEFDDGNIVTEMVHVGMYKITFPNYKLEHHPQFNSHHVDWYQGIVRIHTQNNPTKKRKILEVVSIENIGSDVEDLVIYAIDPQYPVNVPNVDAVEGFDPILTGEQEVNFYPGYRVYLYHDETHHLTESAILPDTGEGMKYSILGLQTEDPNHPEDATSSNEWYRSKISQPALFFAQEIIRPETPLLSNGEEFVYATRPDTFGKSTFTLDPGFIHTPHGVQFYRSNDDAILNALYNPITVLEIKAKLKEDFDSKFHIVKRWQNLLGFDFEYDETYQTDNEFFYYPEEEDGYRFPMPNKYQLYKSINAILEYRNDNYGTNYNLLNLGNPEDNNDNGVIGTIALTEIVIPELTSEGIENDVTFKDYIKSVVHNSFTPLTEIPIMYEHVNDSNYQPIAKNQVVRDESGNLILPPHPDFDMAPMAKRMSQSTIQGLQGEFPQLENGMIFTDFSLDGTSDNLYFYTIREMGNTMQLGDYSPILGPIKLVNTKPPQTPEIKRILPVLQRVNSNPGISVEINAYPKVQNIKKLNLYRTLNANKALSVRTMDLIQTVELEVDGQSLNNIWKMFDEFSDLGFVPYSDPLYYRVTALREVKYADGSNTVDANHVEITQYAPSEPSKLLISSIVENTNPESPILHYNFDPDEDNDSLIKHVILKWNKKVHNGKYHVYKMNNQGNWVSIHTLITNAQEMQLLLDDTSLENGTLSIKNNEGDPIYHHFKVISENSVGMLSTEDKIMTVHNLDNVSPEEGVGNMIVENTNIVR